MNDYQPRYGKSVSITPCSDREGHPNGEADIRFMQDGDEVVLRNVSVSDAEGIAMFLMDYAKGDL